MILTEEEAKTKRCQESFGAADGLTVGGFAESVPMPPHAISYSPVGYFTRQTAPLMCIGSACMAWRWQRTREWDIDTQTGRALEPAVGYCGKAGRP